MCPDRRQFLKTTGCGFGSLALNALLSGTAQGTSNPLAPKPPLI
ncbi:MAG: twin-arginine translocation signal domain-containing protein, partial [Akkermansiaceae bacterium]|nr:twin-arginine translocation signal domain-containing protein [Akkermansiaceae bacterium]